MYKYKHSKIELLQEKEKKTFFSLLNNEKSFEKKNIPKGGRKISLRLFPFLIKIFFLFLEQKKNW